MRNWFTGTGVQVKQVEYKSGGEAATAVLGGHADMTFLFPQNYAPMASADKLKILAIGTKSDVYPNAPTFAEQGYEGNYYGWAGIAAPKGTPKEILDRLAAISEEIVKDPEYIKAIKNMNATPDYSTGEAWMNSGGRFSFPRRGAAPLPAAFLSALPRGPPPPPFGDFGTGRKGSHS